MYKLEVLLLCCLPLCFLFFGESHANIGSCVRNCGQCKSMYGRFFQGTACAESCLQGNDSPDCYNPSMVSRFLKRGSAPAQTAPLSGGYEYYSMEGQRPDTAFGGLIRLLAERAPEARK